METAVGPVELVVASSYFAAVLEALAARHSRVGCYCRVASAARVSREVVFRFERGTRSVELCVDLTVQLLTPADVLAAELARGAEVALRASARRGGHRADR